MMSVFLTLILPGCSSMPGISQAHRRCLLNDWISERMNGRHAVSSHNQSPALWPSVLTSPIPPALFPSGQNTNPDSWLCHLLHLYFILSTFPNLFVHLWNLKVAPLFWVRSYAGHWTQRDKTVLALLSNSIQSRELKYQVSIKIKCNGINSPR